VSDGSGGTKYNNLSHVAMSALTLTHGNAVPERGFFLVNNALLGKESMSLSEKNILAARPIKDVIRVGRPGFSGTRVTRLFSNPETVFRSPKTRDIGFIFGQAFMKHTV